ncbi:MAG: THC0290_0291 family protein [Flavobacterium sp.]
MHKKISLVFLFLFVFLSNATAQYSSFTHEIGITAGPISFRSDYGERNNSESTSRNIGYAVGIVHYLNFTDFTNFMWYTREAYFSEHFRVRSEISYCKTSLKHIGKWAEQSIRLQAMQGSTSVTNLGTQLEFYPFGISDFTNTIGAFSPYIALGAQYSFYDPEIHSSLGPLNTPISTPPKYMNATSNEAGTVFSVVSDIGTRYKLTEYSDLLLEIRWQYYSSDWVDGLNPDHKKYPENKYNDWNVWLNFGYIFYLQ